MMVMLILRTGAARTRKQTTNAVEAAEGDSFLDVDAIHSRRESPKRMVSLESWTWWWYTTATIRPTRSQPQRIFNVFSPVKSHFPNNKLKGSD